MATECTDFQDDDLGEGIGDNILVNFYPLAKGSKLFKVSPTLCSSNNVLYRYKTTVSDDWVYSSDEFKNIIDVDVRNTLI